VIVVGLVVGLDIQPGIVLVLGLDIQPGSRTLRPGFPVSGRPAVFRPRVLTRLARPESDPTGPAEINRGRKPNDRPEQPGTKQRAGGNGPRTGAGEPHRGRQTTGATDPRTGNASPGPPDRETARRESAEQRPERARTKQRPPTPEHRPRKTKTKHPPEHSEGKTEPTSGRPYVPNSPSRNFRVTTSPRGVARKCAAPAATNRLEHQPDGQRSDPASQIGLYEDCNVSSATGGSR